MGGDWLPESAKQGTWQDGSKEHWAPGGTAGQGQRKGEVASMASQGTQARQWNLPSQTTQFGLSFRKSRQAEWKWGRTGVTEAVLRPEFIHQVPPCAAE